MAENRLAHANLIVGPRDVGKLALALELARAVNCLADVADRPCNKCVQCSRIAAGQHADVHLISLRHTSNAKERRKEMSIDDVREVEHLASLMPFEGRCRVFIFDEAERLSEEASNALLKTLEEPPPHVLLVLTTTKEDSLLPTIRSRCQRLEMRPLPFEDVVESLVRDQGLERSEAERLARLSRGRIGWAVNAARDPQGAEERATDLGELAGLTQASLYERFQFADSLARKFVQDREKGRESLYLWLQWWRDVLLVQAGLREFVLNFEQIEELQQEAGRYSQAAVTAFMHRVMWTLDALEHNATPRLALENLMLSMPR